MSDGKLLAGLLLFVITYVIAGLVTGLIGNAFAAGNGRGSREFVLGFFLSLIGLIAAASLEPSEREMRRSRLNGVTPQCSQRSGTYSVPPYVGRRGLLRQLTAPHQG